jgi:hypothetical protein
LFTPTYAPKSVATSKMSTESMKNWSLPSDVLPPPSGDDPLYQLQKMMELTHLSRQRLEVRYEYRNLSFCDSSIEFMSFTFSQLYLLILFVSARCPRLILKRWSNQVEQDCCILLCWTRECVLHAVMRRNEEKQTGLYEIRSFQHEIWNKNELQERNR